MGVRKTVFGSNMERRCFQKLNETWGKDYRVYHNLPFLSVFEAKTNLFDVNYEPLILSDEDFDHLKKTSIDFTMCDKEDAPLVCIEFDGMQDGFNVGSKYHLRSGKPGRKSRRDLIELKLRVAHGSSFPFFVLGSKEFRGFSDTVRLTIADGLIGEVLSVRARNERLNAGFDPTQCGYSADEFDNLSSEEQRVIIEDWALMVEIESDIEHNPIVKENLRLSTKLEAHGETITFLNDEQYDRDKWIWLECGASGRYGTASVKVCMPNFETPGCFLTVHLLGEIGRLLALEQLRKRTSNL